MVWDVGSICLKYEKDPSFIGFHGFLNKVSITPKNAAHPCYNMSLTRAILLYRVHDMLTFVSYKNEASRYSALFRRLNETFDVEASISISFCDHTLQINKKNLSQP
jgi:hypothetical protein